jgi:P4 family phage/plasmid primase-like protien
MAELNSKRVKKYQDDIINFLNKYKIIGDSNVKPSHQIMGSGFNNGKYNLDKEAVKEFNELYGEAVDYGVIFGIGEKPKEYGPILVDIDMELPLEDYKTGQRLYNNDIILDVIKAYRESASKYLDMSKKDNQVAILEKVKPTIKQTCVKDGFHLVFYNLCVKTKLRHLIRNSAIDILKKKGKLLNYINPIEKIIDEAVVQRNCWLMYGSSKNKDEEEPVIYTLSACIGHDNLELDISHLLEDKSKCVKMFSLQRKEWNESKATPYHENIDDDIIDSQFAKNDKHTVYDSKYNINYELSPKNENEVRRASYLVSLFNDERADDYNSWMNVGWALHNVDETLLPIWIDFSKRSRKYKEGICEKEWKNMKDKGLTIRSLMLWAKQDNFRKYEEFIKSEFNGFLLKSLSCDTSDIADALYEKYRDRFVCASIEKHLWYEFKGHRWVKTESGYSFLREIRESFVRELYDFQIAQTQKAREAGGIDREDIEKKIDKSRQLQKMIKNIGPVGKIITDAENKFYDPSFLDKLDEHTHLVAFENGVYDLEKGEFRSGRPDDYITMSTGNDYVEYNSKNPYIEKINDFFRKVFINEEIRRFLLLNLANAVCGDITEQRFIICTGSGSNGKSVLFTFIDKAFGEYACKCDVSIVTSGRKASGSATPEFMQLKGRRFAYMAEPNNNDTLTDGLIKDLTGGEKISVRALYKEQSYLKPQFKFFFGCNNLPKIPSTDGGIWRRLMVCPFNSKFVDTPVKNNEFLLDTTLERKMSDWAPTFMGYLIHIYMTENKKILPSKIPAPEAVKISTNMYKMESNHYQEFFISKIIKTDNKKDFISVTSVYEEFKDWIRLNRHDEKIPNINLFKKGMNEFIENPKNTENRWFGCKINDNKEENYNGSDDDIQPNVKIENNALDA